LAGASARMFDRRGEAKSSLVRRNGRSFSIRIWLPVP
jgi:hypothetical protein